MTEIIEAIARFERKLDLILAQHEALRTTNRELAARCLQFAKDRAAARRALTNHLKEKAK